MGSLLTALASFFDIRQRGGHWQIRIDDIDPPRQVAGAIDDILSCLANHGLVADGPVQYQSDHQQRYRDALSQLADNIYSCDCTRRQLQGQNIYPGTCRPRRSQQAGYALRVDFSPLTSVQFADGVLGTIEAARDRDFGDVVVRRKDALWAYNLATAVDDSADFDLVLRGQDLAATTPSQIAILELLKRPIPGYTHIPVLCYADGVKLSKQTGAPALDNSRAAENLHSALDFLGLKPPSFSAQPVGFWLQWGVDHWSLNHLPARFKAYEMP